MDFRKRSGDGHRTHHDRRCTKRSFESGSSKRANDKKHAEVVAKWAKVDVFVTKTPKSHAVSDSHTSMLSGEPIQVNWNESDSESSSVTGESQDDCEVNRDNVEIPAAGDPEAEDCEKAETNNLQTDFDHDQPETNQGDTSLAINKTSMENDIGAWPDKVIKEQIDYWATQLDVTELQNIDQKVFDLRSTKQPAGENRSRKCTTHMFYLTAQNNELVKRLWLCFSPSTGKLYCYICKLMRPDAAIQLATDGFCDWKHAGDRLKEHEMSNAHVEALIALTQRGTDKGRIDSELAAEAERQSSYWVRVKVLKRVTSVIQFLCERNLAFRGSNEIVGSAGNGNYLGLLELISKYDDFLAEHIQQNADRGSGHTSYLSSTICEELLSLMGSRVLNEITSHIKESKYYSILLDSTPDETHVDQLTLVFRYMEGGNPVERFLTFIPNAGHKAEDMFIALMTFLELHEIDIKNCRGQSYDSANAMSGKYSSFQARVKEENKKATWIPCVSHSLNLVGKTAAECCSTAVSFFDFLQQLHIFFTSSTHRYAVLKKHVEAESKSSKQPIYLPKRLSEMHWSCRVDATKAVDRGYNAYSNALEEIMNDTQEKALVRAQAEGLCGKLQTIENAFFMVFWADILERFNATNHILQNPSVDLNTALASLGVLRSFVESKRGSFEHYEKLAVEKCGNAEWAELQKGVHRCNAHMDDPGTPRPDPGTPRPDPGTPRPDQGTPRPDQGTPRPDQGTPRPDSGTPRPDSGTPRPDSGTPRPDSGTPRPDSGTPRPDSGTPRPDSGTPRPDSGTPWPDSGTRRPDSGTPQPYSGTPQPDSGTPQLVVEQPHQDSAARHLKITSFLPVIDSLSSALQQRIEAYDEICGLFGFFRKLHSLSSEEIQAAAAKLVREFPDDLSNPELQNELCQFVVFSGAFSNEKTGHLSLEHFWYTLIIDKRVSFTFPNIMTALRIYLVLMITNCSGERSFSKLKLIYNRLHTSMTQCHMTCLVLLSIEYDLLRDIDFSDVIHDFAS
uniref:uncharacterized protein n=1 Tax=Myxine glutinosa TaxID=7769 RepID=UPI00358E3B13